MEPLTSDVQGTTALPLFHKDDEKQKTEQSEHWIVRTRRTLREPLAEFLGSMTLILFGDGAIAQVVLSEGKAGQYQSISWGWGIGIMFGNMIAGSISGGHLNPAVTLALCLYRKFSWRKLPAYALAQFAGCFMGAAIVYANYRSAIDVFEGGHNVRTVGEVTSTDGIFHTGAQPFLTSAGQFFSEVIATAILVMGVFAITDNRNGGFGKFAPFGLFFLVFGVGACWGYETGYAINLARDFAPRLFAAMAGYGSGVFTQQKAYFWVPIVAPFFGGAIGGFIYDFFVYPNPENTDSEGPVDAVSKKWYQHLLRD